jgi:hypothetical protein
MATSRAARFRRIAGDGLFFVATALLAYWAMIDRSPGWIMAVYVAGALAVAVAAPRPLVSLRTRHDSHPHRPSDSAAAR